MKINITFDSYRKRFMNFQWAKISWFNFKLYTIASIWKIPKNVIFSDNQLLEWSKYIYHKFLLIMEINLIIIDNSIYIKSSKNE